MQGPDVFEYLNRPWTGQPLGLQYNAPYEFLKNVFLFFIINVKQVYYPPPTSRTGFDWENVNLLERTTRISGIIHWHWIQNKITSNQVLMRSPPRYCDFPKTSFDTEAYSSSPSCPFILNFPLCVCKQDHVDGQYQLRLLSNGNIIISCVEILFLLDDCYCL